MRVPDQLTCLLRNLYAGQEPTVTTGHGTTDCFKIGKAVQYGCMLSFYLFNFYSENIMQNASWMNQQAGIKISRRNINNLKYADDTTLMAESEEQDNSEAHKEPLDEGERGERGEKKKNWLDIQH